MRTKLSILIISVLFILSVFTFLPDVVEANPGFTQKWESWTPGSDNTWENMDLSGSPYSVPANAICEIVITVTVEADKWAGVRTDGSSLDRYFFIHEEELGGVDAVRMHVKASASSIIEIFGDDTDTTFYLTGYWDSGDYTELMSNYTSDADDAWRTITVSDVPADKVAEVVMYNLAATAEVEGGVRDTSSVLDRYFMLQESEPTAESMDLLTMHVEVDGSQQIDVYSGNRFYVKFSIVGYWNTEPGTWNEKMYAIPANAGDAAWEDEDLSGQISANAICEVVNRNIVNNLEMETGVRKKTSSDARFFDLHEAEQGGEDVVTLIVEADASSIIQVYAEVALKARHNLVGYWAVAGAAASLTVTLRKSDNTQERIDVGYWGNKTLEPGATLQNSTNFVRAQCDNCDGVDDSFWVNWSGTTWASTKVGDSIDIDGNFRFYYNEVTGAGEDPDDGGWTWTDSGVDADGDYQITFANSGTTYIWVRFRIEAVPSPLGGADDYLQTYVVTLDR